MTEDDKAKLLEMVDEIEVIALKGDEADMIDLTRSRAISAALIKILGHDPSEYDDLNVPRFDELPDILNSLFAEIKRAREHFARKQ